jgi:uncharacterized cofD-like protein
LSGPAEGPARRGPPRRGPRVVALGGGHGLATTLRAARMYAGEVTAVVSVADDGGSSGRLRSIAGIPAPGDLRRCLVAMASDTSLWARAFEYRFPAGVLDGHSLGNLIIAGLANVTGDFGEALECAARLLETAGRVLPATSVPVDLKAEVAGREVVGQVKVSEWPGTISRVSVVPPDAPVGEAVLEALAEADQIVIGPGSLFTSVLAVCVVPRIKGALLAATNAQRVYVCNLRPQPPETAGFAPVDHLRALLDHGVPVDAMVAPVPPVPPVAPVPPPAASAAQGSAAPGGEASLLGVRVFWSELARPDGGGHDTQRLAATLAELT